MEKSDKADSHIGLLDRTEKLLSQTREPEKNDTDITDDITQYINELRKKKDIQETEDKKLLEILEIISKQSEGSNGEDIDGPEGEINKKDTDTALEEASKEISVRKQIEEYYLPKQLVQAIVEKGGIPKESEQCIVGIG
ncbi:MAG: hypothetical protein KAR21_15990, partial [Spirochaetales bacterium]|nr:hypothetical protein [Spirochaetales bacterium]